MPKPEPVGRFAGTYRLQLSEGFTFEDAAAAVPYIASLGVSHLYLSPIWESVAGSTHGYDVVDHAAVRHELGGMAGLLRLSAAAEAAGLGIVVDIVPNHVGVAGARHPWWRDVLRFGEASRYASFFDIDWQGRLGRPGGVVVLPVLGRSFGEALEDGELSLAFDGEEIVVRYFEHSFPISPGSYRTILGTPPVSLADELRDPAAYADISTALEGLGEGPNDERRHGLNRIARLIASEPGLAEWVRSRLASFSGDANDAASWDGLDAVLSAQHYRLAYWRVSGDEINYRRFFDINDLAAIRQENPEVFEATHALVRTLAADGVIQGLRVDHIDGLYDPAAYLSGLAALAPGLPVWVEKILAVDETLPPDWHTAGATGYEFLATAGGLFVDPSGEAPLTSLYREFTGSPDSFQAIAAEARIQVAESSFAGELGVLAAQLQRLAQRERRFRDVTFRGFRAAIEALLAAFPVYRTYLVDGQPRDVDREIVENAARLAARLDPAVPPEAFTFLVRVLLLDSERLSAEERARWAHFRRRFQQISGPVMAKGVEDTTFFRYNRLLAGNEVGAHPSQFAESPPHFHAWAAERADSRPLSLSATSTHDTKRSEDARMRLSVLSELPGAWRREVRAWSRLNERHRTGDFPDRNTEYYLYQSLIAAFEGAVTPEFVERIAAHMTKAVREAKVHTSWSSPDEAFEGALEHFIRASLHPRDGRRFVDRLARWVERLEPAARVNSLALLALKCLTPGVPDTYQGSELPFFALTDPDNRRPVPFPDKGIEDAPAAPPAGFAEAKPWLLRRLLALRTKTPQAFLGGYAALDANGPGAGHVVAFQRMELKGACIAVIVPRLVAGLAQADGSLALPSVEVPVPEGFAWTDWIASKELGAAESVDAARLLAAFPVAVLLGEPQ